MVVLFIGKMCVFSQNSYGFQNYRDGNKIFSIHSTNSSIYTTTSNGVIERNYDGEVVNTINTEDGLISNIVYNAFAVNDNEIWLVTPEALHYYYDKNKNLVFNQNTGLLNNTFSSICQDENEDIWVANFGGLSKYSNNTWSSYAYTDTIGFNSIICHDNEIWCATDGFSVVKFNGINWNTLNQMQGLPSNRLSKIRKDPSQDIIWIATIDSGLIEFNQNWIHHYNNLLDSRFINDFQIDGNKTKWLFTDNGVIKVDSTNSWQLIDSLSHIEAIHGEIDADNNLWIATINSLIKYFPKNDSILQFKVEGLSHNMVNSIKTEINGTNWIGTYGGISTFNKNWVNIPFSDFNNSISNAIISNIKADSKNRIWLSYYNPIELAYLDSSGWHVLNSGNSSLNTSSPTLRVIKNRECNILINKHIQPSFHSPKSLCNHPS